MFFHSLHSPKYIEEHHEASSINRINILLCCFKNFLGKFLRNDEWSMAWHRIEKVCDNLIFYLSNQYYSKGFLMNYLEWHEFCPYHLPFLTQRETSACCFCESHERFTKVNILWRKLKEIPQVETPETPWKIDQHAQVTKWYKNRDWLWSVQK